MQNNPYPHGIDITAPGGITALMAFHRQTFGDAVMEDNGAPAAASDAGTPPAGAEAGAGAPAGAPAAAGDAGAPAAAAADAGTPPAAAESVDQLPAWAQKLIKDTRKEAGDNRTKATAAEQQAQGILAAVAKAAGIEVPGDTPPDPAQLAKDLAAERDAKAATARELAIFKAASTAGADPAKLLDSRSFMTSVQGLDPSDGTAVAAAIKAAVDANASLKAARAAGTSGIQQTAGNGELGQITEQQLQKMSPEQIVEAQAKGLLRNLMSGGH